MLTGGGTGGHITPILAVAHELKKQAPDTTIIYVGERGGKFAELTASSEAIDKVYTIWSGKFRRYHARGLRHTLTDYKTPFLNLRDMFYFFTGTVQSWLLLGKLKPNAILLKGGFVGVPVGLAAALRHKRFVTHDSDVLPGLANRTVSRWATVHAVALPPEMYAYPQASTKQVGVLTEPNFQLVDQTQQAAFKQQIGLDAERPVLLITGGSSGAQRLNEAVVEIVSELLTNNPTLQIVHQVGKGKAGVYGDYAHDRLQVVEFMRPMYAYTGAADVVVARASANTIAELGIQRKPVIVVASPFLAGGHQLKNAELLVAAKSAVAIAETINGTDAAALNTAIQHLLDDEAARTELANNLHDNTLPDAAARLATILLDIGKTK